MAVDYSKLLDHPDSELIISKLISSITPKDVSEWLKIKYQSKEEAHLRLPASLLKDFLEQNLNLYNTIQQDIQHVKNGTSDKKISAALKANKTYQELMVETVSKEIDVKEMLRKVGILIEKRLEQIWDKMQQSPENMKPDYVLLKYFETLLNFTEKFNKIVNQAPDQIIQHNVTVQVMDQYVTVIQDSIRQTLAEMDSDAANFFMEKFNDNLSKLQLPESMQPVKPQTQEQRYLGAEILQSKLEEIEGKV